MTQLPRRGRTLAYARYQLSDFLLLRALVPLGLVGLVAGIHLLMVTKGVTPEIAAGAEYISRMKTIYSTEITIFLPLCAFLGAVMVASADRHLGHFRFFFSKPVSVRHYYVQTYLVHGVAFVALFGLITWGFELRSLVTQSVMAGMGAAALSFVLLGGLGFLLGNFAQSDALGLPVLYVTALILQMVITTFPKVFSEPVKAFARALPPAVALDSVQKQLYAATEVNTGELWHVLLYGGAAFAIGVLIIRRVPLSQ